MPSKHPYFNIKSFKGGDISYKFKGSPDDVKTLLMAAAKDNKEVLLALMACGIEINMQQVNAIAKTIDGVQSGGATHKAED